MAPKISFIILYLILLKETLFNPEQDIWASEFQTKFHAAKILNLSLYYQEVDDYSLIILFKNVSKKTIWISNTF